MAIDATILAVGVKAEGVKEVTGDLGKLATQAGQTEQAARRLGDGFNSQLSSLAKTEQANNALIESWAKEVAMLGKTKSEVMGLEAAHNKFTAAQMESVRILQGQIKAYEDAQRAAKQYAEEQEAATRSVQSLVAAAKVAAAALTAMYGISIKNAAEAEQSSLRLEAVLKATGGAAGVTKEQIDRLADSMAQVTQFDDEALRNAAGTLLTFGSVGVTSFERTLRAGTDLAAFIGTDLNSAMRMLGKALEDPSVGMTALRRTGIILTDSQIELAKAAVDAGDKLEAQRIILEAVEGKVGGVAEKMNSGLRQATSDAAKAFDELTESMGKSQIIGGTFVTVMEAITNGMKAMKNAIDNLKPSDWAQLAVPDFGLLTPGGAASYATGRGAGPLASGKIGGLPEGNAEAAEREANAQNMVTEARKKAGEALAKLIASYTDEKQKLAESESALRTHMTTLGYSNEQIEQQVQLMRKHASASTDASAARREASLLEKNYADTMKRLNDEATKSLAITKPLREEEERLAALYSKSVEQAEKRTMTMEKEAEKEQQRAAKIGLTKEQVNLLEAAWLDEAIARAEATLAAQQGAESDEAETERLRRQVEALKALQQARRDAANSEAMVAALREEAKLAKQVEREWQQVFENVSQFAGDFLVDFARNGKSAFQNLWDSFKNMAFRALAELATRQIMVNVGAMLMGGGAASSAGASTMGSIGGNMIGSVGGSFLGGGFVNSAGIGTGLIGGGLDALFGAGGASAFAGGMASPIGTLTTLFGGTGGAPIGAGMALEAGLGAMVPVIGTVLAVGLLVKSFLDSKKGGPKSGGFGSIGNISGISGADGGRWFTPDNADSDLNSITRGVDTAYQTALKALGGTGTAGFALGYDTDPQGTAPDRLHAGTFVGGRQVYNADYGDLGRGGEQLEQTMALEAKRMLIAALKASDLPKQIAAVFDTVDVSGLSSEAADNLIAFGSAMQVVIDAISGDIVADAQTAWEQSQRTGYEVLVDMGDEVIRLAGAMDGSTQSMEELAGGTTAFRNAVGQALLAVKAIKQEAAQLFAATYQQIEMYGKTPTQLYQYYMADVDAAAAELKTTKDPATARALATRINNDLLAAFNALPDDQKGVMQPLLMRYIYGADGNGGINAFVQGELDRIEGGIEGLTTDPFAAANAALDTAAGKFDAAAAKQDGASDKFVQGVNAFGGYVQNFAAAQPIRVVATVAPVPEVGGA